jgi:hypothetical protein
MIKTNIRDVSGRDCRTLAPIFVLFPWGSSFVSIFSSRGTSHSRQKCSCFFEKKKYMEPEIKETVAQTQYLSTLILIHCEFKRYICLINVLLIDWQNVETTKYIFTLVYDSFFILILMFWNCWGLWRRDGDSGHLQKHHVLGRRCSTHCKQFSIFVFPKKT